MAIVRNKIDYHIKKWQKIKLFKYSLIAYSVIESSLAPFVIVVAIVIGF